LAQVRTKLTELVGELVALTPDDRQPTKEAADTAIYYIINGDRNVITNLRQDVSGGSAVAAQGTDAPVTVAETGGTAIGSQTASGAGSSVIGSQVAGGHSVITGRDSNQSTPAPTAVTKESFWKGWRKRGIFIGFATVLAAVVGVLQWLDWTPW
jgi:hypothetical protein